MGDRSGDNRGAQAEYKPTYSKRVWDNVAQADATNQMGPGYDFGYLPSPVWWPLMYPQPVPATMYQPKMPTYPFQTFPHVTGRQYY